ncbi:hypothetical protein QJU96_08090 [Pasteurella skyensis]|uniref:Uncharacterized protein n=1 Tax=Phocoenobacter skyensis TaxID=97481 RepID=A0AAJ6P2D7_9PAST|nr:hypothetical protein [Pasteurella skyensis]MDP8171244.1 hypothetical protein [Pasteurella skyensis]MDP8174692.1 hypothetical protein [Pasteurella skyensis]
MIKRKTLVVERNILSLNWLKNDLVDWISGDVYSLNGESHSNNKCYDYYKFDACIQSDNGVYAVIYEKLGTKALLLKKGEILRELNRSFYQADIYEYPVCFLQINKKYFIVHCPNNYNQIEIEDIETGTNIIDEKNRTLSDCFYSRLKINNASSILVNTGWIWHPADIINIYDIEKILADISFLDTSPINPIFNAEICSAEFLTDDLLIIASSNEEAFDDTLESDPSVLNPNRIGIFSIKENKFIKKINVKYALGTLIPIDEDYVIDLYDYPKLIDINSGKIIQHFKDINSGKQNSSIIHHIEKIPPIAVDCINKRIAIVNNNNIEILMYG